MMWPSIGEKAVSEYNTDIKVFAMAFFWLFPGGIGDLNDQREVKVSMTEWVKHMMMYDDGRFFCDQMFPF